MAKNLYLGKNGMSSADLYYYRKLYKDNVMLEASDKKIDLLYDIPNYGKVNFGNEPIFLSESNLKQLSSKQGTFLALDFVVDAFEDLQRYFEKAIGSKRIKQSGVLGTIEPKKAWISFRKIYHAHVDALYRMFAMSYLRGKENDIKIIEDFLEEFLVFVESIKSSLPITSGNFIKSRLCTINVSGLAIEIDDGDKGEDFPKQKNILEDENYIFFKQASKRFGFFVDKFTPYRLVFDIMSPIAKKYMKVYGIDNTQLFKTYYYSTIDDELDVFKSYMIHFWSGFISQKPFVKEIKHCLNKTTLSVVVARERYDENFPKLDDNFWLELYTRIRLIESLKNFNEPQVNKKIKDVLDLNKLVDKSNVLRYIKEVLT